MIDRDTEGHLSSVTYPVDPVKQAAGIGKWQTPIAAHSVVSTGGLSRLFRCAVMCTPYLVRRQYTSQIDELLRQSLRMRIDKWVPPVKSVKEVAVYRSTKDIMGLPSFIYGRSRKDAWEQVNVCV
jgi:hypothetical protein